MKNDSDGVDSPPKGKHDDAAHGNYIVNLISIIVRQKHGDVQTSKNGDAIDSEVRG